MAIGVAFGIQRITYIRPRGLGDEDVGDKVAFGRGWEEDCRFQACVTLSISLHDRHHQDSRAPYDRLALSPDSPRLPTGKLLLTFASMVPTLCGALMVPAHDRWLAVPGQQLSADRHLTCFGLDKPAASAGERAI